MTSLDKKKYSDLAFTRFRIHSGFNNFHSGERIERVADSSSSYTGYVWTVAVSGKKMLRIQSYLSQRLLGRLLGTGEKDWPIADRRATSDNPRNNCGPHLGSISLFVSKVASFKGKPVMA